MSEKTPSSERPDDRLVPAYWSRIAAFWTNTIRNGNIASRELVTNRAVVEAILERTPDSVLDLGCGEGWLCRELAKHGISATGTDAVSELVDSARSAGHGDYRVMTYEEIAAGKLGATADVVVCNFSLLGKESTEGVVRTVPLLLNEGGAFIVQTLHPHLASIDEPYVNGWRSSSWMGITDEIKDPSPWYFRTFGTWIRLFVDCELRIIAVREPLHPETGRPASVIFVAAPLRDQQEV